MYSRICANCGNEFVKKQNVSLKNWELNWKCCCAKCANTHKRGKFEAHNKTHGMKHSRIYGIWEGMKKRCDNPNVESYKHYGMRGIGYDPNWKNFINFFQEMQEGYSDSLTLDRIDNNSGYSKSNCRWTTKLEQANNKSTNHFILYNDKKLTIQQWSRETGIDRHKISDRIHRGWSVERTLTTP